MTQNPTYDDLRSRTKELEEESARLRRAEEALSRSEAFNRRLLEHLPQRIFIKDHNSTYIACNANYARDLGIPPEQIAGKVDFDIHPRDLAESYRADDQIVMATGMRKDVVERYRLAGEERWIHTSKVPYQDEQGQVLGVVGIFENITDRKRAETALQESEERARRTAEVNRTMAELGRIISSTLSIEEIYEQFASMVRRIIPFDRLMIGLINEAEETWTLAHESGFKVKGRCAGDVLALTGFIRDIFRKRSGDFLHLKDEKELTETYPMLLPTFQAGTRSIMAAPLIAKGQVIGVIQFSSLTPETYTEGDVALAGDVAGQIAGAVANAQIHDQIKKAEQALKESERKARESAEVNRNMAELSQIISSTLSIEEVYEKFADVVKRVVPFDRLTIGVIGPEQDIYAYEHTIGIELPERKKGDRVEPLPPIVADVVRKRSGVLVHADDEGFPKDYPVLPNLFKLGIRSVISAPFISRGTVTGALLFFSLSKTYTEDHLRLAEGVARQISGAVANAQLFAEHRRIEKALQESERKFRNIFDCSSDAIIIHDLDGRIMEANEVASTRLGYTHEEVLRMTIMDITAKEFASGFRERIQITTQKNRQVFESFNQGKDGTGFPVEVHSRVIEYGGKTCILSVSRDITERKRAEEELIRHRDMLGELVKERTDELEKKSTTLEELNVALRVLLRQVQEDREKLEHRLVSNVKRLVLPYVEKMKKGGMDEQARSYLGIVESNLCEIMSPFLHNVQQLNLTPRETQIASLIRDGKTTKEIGEIIGVAPSAVDSHRHNIRGKLNLNNKKINLRNYLQSLK